MYLQAIFLNSLSMLSMAPILSMAPLLHQVINNTDASQKLLILSQWFCQRHTVLLSLMQPRCDGSERQLYKSAWTMRDWDCGHDICDLWIIASLWMMGELGLACQKAYQ